MNQPHVGAVVVVGRLKVDVGKAIAEIDVPRLSWIIDIRRTRPEALRICVDEISRVYSRTRSIENHQGEEFAPGGHAPAAGEAAQNCPVDSGDEFLGVAAYASRTSTPIRCARIGAVGGEVGAVPSVGAVFIAQTAGGFDFPGQSGDVVFGAGPIACRSSQRRSSAKHRAVVGDLAVVKALGARAGLGKLPRRCGGIAPIAAILARMGSGIASNTGRVGCGHTVGYGVVVTGILPGIWQASRMGRHLDGKQQGEQENVQKSDHGCGSVD